MVPCHYLLYLYLTSVGSNNHHGLTVYSSTCSLVAKVFQQCQYMAARVLLFPNGTHNLSSRVLDLIKRTYGSLYRGTVMLIFSLNYQVCIFVLHVTPCLATISRYGSVNTNTGGLVTEKLRLDAPH
jgi:hypothetical protein